jgi:hypothetical protein
MSKSKQVSYAWPPSFLFRANTVPSNGSQLEERQKLAKFISNLCEELNMYDFLFDFILFYFNNIFLEVIHAFIKLLFVCIDF